MHKNIKETQKEMPVGLRMALTQDINALNKFSALPESRQVSFIDGARSVESKQDMREYVNKLSQG